MVNQSKDTHGAAVNQFGDVSTPMLFRREGESVALQNMFRGSAAFLICSGPSLITHDLSLLAKRGILSMSVNNAATVVRTQLWCSVDDPGNFSDAIWRDPGITKFVPQDHMEKSFMVRDDNRELTASKERVGDMPSVFGFRRNETFRPSEWLHEPTFNWGCHSRSVDEFGNKGSRSVMYVAIRLLFYLGVRRIFLLGCDFRMQIGQQNYAFEQDRTRSSVRGNNSSYRILNSRLTALQPYFQKEGLEIFNCTPNSGLTVFPSTTLEEAISAAQSAVPKEIITRGMYERASQARAAAAVPKVTSEFRDFSTIVTLEGAAAATAFQHTWPTWRRNKPLLAESPLLVRYSNVGGKTPLHPAEFHPRGQWIGLPTELQALDQSQSILGLLDAIESQVRSPWCLLLDPAAVATAPLKWPAADWFCSEGSPVAMVGAAWGYSRPADILDRLGEWSDRIPELAKFPRPAIAGQVEQRRVCFSTIAPWCLFVNCTWLKSLRPWIASHPVPGNWATALQYMALRMGWQVRPVPMKSHGWDHNYGRRRLQVEEQCAKIISTG